MVSTACENCSTRSTKEVEELTSTTWDSGSELSVYSEYSVKYLGVKLRGVTVLGSPCPQVNYIPTGCSSLIKASA